MHNKSPLLIALIIALGCAPKHATQPAPLSTPITAQPTQTKLHKPLLQEAMPSIQPKVAPERLRNTIPKIKLQPKALLLRPKSAQTKSAI